MKKLLSVLLATIMLFSTLSCLTMSASAVYDSMSSARSISSGISYTGTIATSDTEDYYKFTLSSSSTVTLSVNAALRELYITVYDADGNQIADDGPDWNSGGQIVFNRTYTFTKGTYYIKISKGYYSYEDNYGNYSFKLTTASSNETFAETKGGIDNSIATANNISPKTTYKGQIAFNDTVDFYKFNLSSSSSVTLDVNGTLRELYVTIYDEDGNQIADDGPDWNSSGQIVFNRTYTFTKGTYYIKISKGYYSYDDNYGNYSFKFTTSSANETFAETKGGIDNSIATANNISPKTTYKGQIAFNDTVDFYKFNLSSSSSVTLDVNGTLRELYVTIYDEDGNQIADDGPDWNSSGQIVFNRTYTFTKGTYYIKISKGYYSYDDNYGNYSFKFTTSSANETFAETKGGIDNSIATANKISLGKTYKGQIAFNDLDDYYKFSVSDSKININVSGKISELYIRIYDVNGSEVFYASASSNDSGSISYFNQLTLAEGTYYLKISKGYYSYDNNYGSYSFKISKYIPATSITSISNSTKGVTIKWTKVAGVSGYYVYRKTSGGSYSKIKTVTDGSAVSYTDENVKSGKTYYYYVKAYSGSSTSEKSGTAKIKRLSRPVLKSASNTENGVLVKWAETTGAYGYKVYRKTSDGWKYLGKTTKTYYTDKTAKSGKKYTYTVRAYSGDSVSSYNSSGVSKYYLANPTLKTPTSTTSGVKLSWGKVAGSYGYKVYRKTSDGWKYLGKTTKTYYTDKTATSGKKYTYTVRAYSGDSVSSYSSSGVSKYYLADPTLKTPTSTTSGIKLSWTKSAGAEGYIIYRKTGSGSYTKLKTEKGVSNLSYTDSSAKKGKKYTYKVKAYKSKTYSAYSNTKTITDKY